MALSFNFLVTQHFQMWLLCTVNFQVYESYVPKMKTRKLSSPARHQEGAMGAMVCDSIPSNQTQ